MDTEKKIKLGLDTNELANKLVSINQLLKENHNLSISGQNQYNELLKRTNNSLDKQIDKLSKLVSSRESLNNISSGSSAIESGSGNNGDILSILKEIKKDTGSIDGIMAKRLPQSSNSGGGGGPVNPSGGGGQSNQNNSDSGQSSANAFNKGAGVAVSRNDAYMMAAVMTMIPAVGQGIGMVVSKLLQEGERISTARGQYYGITGVESGLGSLQEIGLSQAASLEKEANYRRASTRVSVEDLYAEKAFSLNSGTISELLKSLRNDTSNTSAGGATNLLLGSLSGTVGERAARGYAEEYLRILVQLNREQLISSGKVENALNTSVVTKISELGESFKNPEVLSYTISQMQSSLKQAATPQIQALQYYTLQNIKPDASLWELEKMKQNPFASNYLPEFLKGIVDISGKGDEAYFNVASVLNMKSNPKLVEEIVNSVREGKFETLATKVKEGYNLEAEAATATPAMQRLTAEQSDRFAGIGEKLIESTESVEKAVEKVLKKVEDATKATETFSKIGDTLKNIEIEVKKKISGILPNNVKR